MYHDNCFINIYLDRDCYYVCWCELITTGERIMFTDEITSLQGKLMSVCISTYNRGSYKVC